VQKARLCLVFLLIAAYSGYGWTGTYTHGVPIEANLPRRPLIEPLPVTIGVYYSPEFSTHTHEEIKEVEGDTNKYKFILGSKSVLLFDQVFSSMFEKVILVEKRPPLGPIGLELAAIIEPSIEEIRISVVRHSSNYERSLVVITYRIALYSTSGIRLASYSVEGSGESRPSASIGTKSFGEATHFAMRDAAAQFMAGFQDQQGVKEWFEDIGLVSSLMLPKRKKR
jgi:hypothetical protein